MNVDDLERDLAALLARHSDATGREWVETCLRVAEGYFESDDLPILAGVGLVLEQLRH